MPDKSDELNYGSFFGDVECPRRAYRRCRRAGFDHQTSLDIVQDAVVVVLKKDAAVRRFRPKGQGLSPHERCLFLHGVVTKLILGKWGEATTKSTISLNIDDESGSRTTIDPHARGSPAIDDRILELIDFTTVQLTDEPGQRLRSTFLVWDSGQERHEGMGRFRVAKEQYEVAQMFGVDVQEIRKWSTRAQSQFSLILLAEAAADPLVGRLSTEYKPCRPARGTPAPSFWEDEHRKRVWVVFLRVTDCLPDASRIAVAIEWWCRCSRDVTQLRLNLSESQVAQAISEVKTACEAELEKRSLDDEVLRELPTIKLRDLLAEEYHQWAT